MEKLILAGMALAWPIAAWAADPFDVKPGLWEFKTAVTSEVEMSAKAARAAAAKPRLTEEQLAALPPKERAQAEAGMRGHLAVGTPRTGVLRICQTAESWAESLTSGPPGDHFCKPASATASATRMEVHMDCNSLLQQPGGLPVLSTYSDDIVVERVDSGHTKGSLAIKVEGRPPTFTLTLLTGEWLSADCGDVKPFSPKK